MKRSWWPRKLRPAPILDSEMVSNNFIIKMTESDISLHAANIYFNLDCNELRWVFRQKGINMWAMQHDAIMYRPLVTLDWFCSFFFFSRITVPQGGHNHNSTIKKDFIPKQMNTD